jgi:hypothetical protein
LLALFLLVLLFERKTLRQQGAHLLAALALAVIVALPIGLYFRANGTIFMERAVVTGILDGQTGWLSQEAVQTGQSPLALFQKQFWQAFLAFNGSQDNSPSYRPNVPLLNFGTAVLFALGLIISLLRLRQLKFSMLVVWVLVTLLFAGALLIAPPQSHRLLIAIPAVMLLAAIALVEIAQLAHTALTPSPHPPTSSPKFLLALTTVAAVLALSDVAFYYGRYPQTHEFADANTEAAYAISQYLNTLDGEWSAYFYGPPAMYVDFPTFPYLLPQFQKDVNFFDVARDASPDLTADGSQVFIFLPERAGEITAVERIYPNGHLETINGHYRTPLLHIYVTSPD